MRTHGTRSAYNHGCRCEKCRAAHAAYSRDYFPKYYSANRERLLEYQRAYRVANPEKLRNSVRERHATTSHGITRVIRDWMYESQDSACAGCKTPMPDAELEIDHDHDCCPGERSCGRCVRALLCRGCNAREGWATTRREAMR